MVESLIQQGRQIFLPFMIAGVGMVLAGFVLDGIQRWELFMRYPEVLVMIPALLGLKGNIEMTLASRLSTSANVGLFNDRRVLKEIIASNIAISQMQAIIVGFFSALIALMTNVRELYLEKVLIMITCSVLTASVTSLLLGLVISFIIVVAHHHGINPDNVATPIAASLGDFCTLWILSRIMFYLDLRSTLVVYLGLLLSFILLIPLLIMIATKNASTAVVLRQGWTPVIIAMCISSCGGVVLRFSVKKLPQLAMFQPLINGLGGNLASIYASRLSTSLHQSHRLQVDTTEVMDNDGQIFWLLTIMAGIGHVSLSSMVTFISHVSITYFTLAVYLGASLLQVRILLYSTRILVQWLWDSGQDPDNAAIPYLTSMGDLLGTGLLTIGLYFRMCFV